MRVVRGCPSDVDLPSTVRRPEDRKKLQGKEREGRKRKGKRKKKMRGRK